MPWDNIDWGYICWWDSWHLSLIYQHREWIRHGRFDPYHDDYHDFGCDWKPGKFSETRKKHILPRLAFPKWCWFLQKPTSKCWWNLGILEKHVAKCIFQHHGELIWAITSCWSVFMQVSTEPVPAVGLGWVVWLHVYLVVHPTNRKWVSSPQF